MRKSGVKPPLRITSPSQKLLKALSLFQPKNVLVLQTKKVKNEISIFPKAEFESDKNFISLSEEFEILTATIEQLKKSIRR